MGHECRNERWYGLPMTYLLAPDGKVAKQFLGPVTAREIEAAIAGAGGPAAS